MKRIAALDTLRGLSLFGILVVNAPFFLMPEGSFGQYGAMMFPRWWDQLATFVMHALFEGKFILIFSFLFGWGLHTQMSRDADFKPAYYRRLAGLLVIGLLHAVFLFVGDILVSYAILGVPLLWVRHWPPEKLVRGAVACWLVSVACHAGLGFLASAEPLSNSAAYPSLVDLHRFGPFGAIVENRITELVGLYIITPFFFMPSVFGMFMLGLAAAKCFATTGLGAAKPLARQVLRWTVLPALALNLAYGALSVSPAANDILLLTTRALAVVTLSLFYLAAAALILTRPAAERWGSLAGGEGRMSLSLYIGESLSMGLIAYSYGLGLFGQVGPAAQMLIAIGVYAALLAFSAVWLKVFKMGPMEWILRSITTGKMVAMR
jgi:uncharacterized protein